MAEDTDNLIDYETTDMLLETLEEDFFEVIHEFIKSGDNISSQLKQQVDQGINDIDTLIALSHTLKGASGNVGALLLSDICGKLETTLHEKQFTHISKHVAEIEQIYSKTKNEYLRVFKIAS